MARLLVFAAALFLFPAYQAESQERLPDGRSRDLALAKHDHEKQLEDVDEILRLAEKLKAEIKENREFAINLDSLRKAEEIEKLAKKIQKRMKRLR